MPKHHYGAAPKGVDEPPDTTPDAIKREFGNRLNQAMLDRGWNQVELARASSKYMAEREFGKYLVGPYIRGERMPHPTHLSAMARALGKTPRDLLPYAGVPGTPTTGNKAPSELTDLGEGKAWLRINKEVSMKLALEIMEKIRASTEA